MTARLKRSRAGFTLVELIVVIAILAILAGVAIPVYSNYIAKANEAADLQLLGAMNTAFAASCVEMGVEPTQLVATAELQGEAGSMTVTGVSAVRRGGASLAAGSAPLDSAALNEAFLRYFAGNQSTPFKVYTSLGYDSVNGVFVDGAKEITVPYGSGTITVTAADLNAYQTSTFSALGVETLTSTIGELADHVVTTFTSSIAGDPESGREPSPAFMAFLNTLDLGKKPDGTDRTIDDLTLNERANAIALWVASSSNGLNAAEIAGRMANGESPLEGGGTDGLMASYAMQYAMLMAYANTDMAASNPVVTPGGTDSFTGLASDRQAWYNALVAEYGEGNVTITSGSLTGRGQTTVTVSLAGSETQISDLFSTVSGDNLSTAGLAEVYGKVAATEGFQSYMQGQGANDLSGYLATMNMINDNTGNLDVYQLLSSGFTDTSLNAMLKSILGN